MSAEQALLAQAKQFYLSGKWTEVVPLCDQALKLDAANIDAWLLQATARYRLGDADRALDSVKQALLVDPLRPALHAFAGELWQAKGNPGEAEQAYRRALSANPQFSEAHNSLGTLLRDAGRLEEATQSFRNALEDKPNYTVALNNLGACLFDGGKSAEARDAFMAALKAEPNYPAAHYNLARIYIQQNDDTQAAEHLQQAIDAAPERDDARFLLAGVKRRQGDIKAAIQEFQAAIKLRPQSAAYINALAETVWEQGDLDAGLALYNHVLTFAPDNLHAAICTRLLLPVVYKHAEEVATARNRFDQGLNSLLRMTGTFRSKSAPEIERDIPWANFYLAYQGGDDLELQIRYAKFVREILSAAAPQFYEPRTIANPRQLRLRVGFISNNFYDCTAGRYFSSWITQLDKTRFETFVYHLNTFSDGLTGNVRDTAATFKDVASLSLFGLAGEVLKDELDVIVFPELGMHPLVFALASLRLAPVQCAGWGHPVTSGHANVDYFLTSALMEPEGAQKHYSESLHPLPGLGTHYRMPDTMSTAGREDFQLPADKILYLVPQSLYKIHPDNDALFLDILEAERDAVIVMFATDRQVVAKRQFVDRLESQFAQRGLATEGRIRILPTASHEDYLRINQLCDVMLDTLHWSGGNTSLDAIASGLPIVTMVGKFMRGRQSFGMLKEIGCEELVAKDRADYLSIALKLGRDRAWRNAMSQRLAENRGRLFAQDAPVRALEEFLLRATGRA